MITCYENLSLVTTSPLVYHPTLLAELILHASQESCGNLDPHPPFPSDEIDAPIHFESDVVCIFVV